MRKTALAALTALLLLFAAQAAANEQWADWKAGYDKQDLKVESRKNKESGVVQIRATARLGCSTGKLWDLLTSDESFLRFMPDMTESRQVKDGGELDEGWWYQRIVKPPITDRDFILHVQWTIEETALGRRYLRWWAVDDAVGPPPIDDVLRLHTNNGSWRFVPVKSGGTDFEYVNYIELEGSLWKMITNRAARSNAVEFLRNLEEECR
jgi:hypothetical protein